LILLTCSQGNPLLHVREMVCGHMEYRVDGSRVNHGPWSELHMYRVSAPCIISPNLHLDATENTGDVIRIISGRMEDFDSRCIRALRIYVLLQII
jgi:hypothetical protein